MSEQDDPAASIFPGVTVEGHDKAETWGSCGCVTCVCKRLVERDGHSLFMPFIVCPECGNKRCPKATHHDHKCSGSNEPGQAGSRFADLPAPATTEPQQGQQGANG